MNADNAALDPALAKDRHEVTVDEFEHHTDTLNSTLLSIFAKFKLKCHK